MRSALAFVLVVPAAYLSDIRWVIAGELVAGVLGFLASCKLAGLTLENLNGLRPSLHSATNGVLRGVTANKGLLVSVSLAGITNALFLTTKTLYVISSKNIKLINLALLQTTLSMQEAFFVVKAQK